MVRLKKGKKTVLLYFCDHWLRSVSTWAPIYKPSTNLETDALFVVAYIIQNANKF